MEDLMKMATELMENDNYKKDTYAEIPDGEYAANIDSIELKTSQNTGSEYIAFKLTILDGDFAERKMFVNKFLTEKTTKSTVTAIMRLITSCGYDLDASMFADFETLVECLQTLVNTAITVTKTTKGEFTNYVMLGGAE